MIERLLVSKQLDIPIERFQHQPYARVYKQAFIEVLLGQEMDLNYCKNYIEGVEYYAVVTRIPGLLEKFERRISELMRYEKETVQQED